MKFLRSVDSNLPAPPDNEAAKVHFVGFHGDPRKIYIPTRAPVHFSLVENKNVCSDAEKIRSDRCVTCEGFTNASSTPEQIRLNRTKK